MPTGVVSMCVWGPRLSAEGGEGFNQRTLFGMERAPETMVSPPWTVSPPAAICTPPASTWTPPVDSRTP